MLEHLVRSALLWHTFFMKAHSNNAQMRDNQQERFQSFFYFEQREKQNFYYTGFCTGELSCSLLKLTNRKSKTGGVYYMPDITISNADKPLLEEINNVVACGCGVISAIKGGYNLSIRGKVKAKKALAFFEKYPPIAGDLVKSKFLLIKRAIVILESRKTFRRTLQEENQLEKIRSAFVQLKRNSIPLREFSQDIFNPQAIGYFLSGILDAEGSVGMKRNGFRHQPFIAVAMKDKKIIQLFRDFLGVGNIRFRSKDFLYHFEIGSRKEVLRVLYIFSKIYPSRLPKMKQRIEKLESILNDYTQGSQSVALAKGYDIV